MAIRPIQRLMPLVLVLAVVVLMSACTSAPIVRPTKTAPTLPRSVPPLASLVVSASGLGPIRLGEPVSGEAARRGIVSFDPTECVGDIRDDGYVIAAGDEDAGGWRPGYPKLHEPYGGSAPFSVSTAREDSSGPLRTKTSVVLEIGVWDASIRTSTGVGIGSTLPQLSAAYPGLAHAVDGQESDVYVAAGSPADIWFEIEKPDPAYWTDGNAGRVLWMTLVPHGAEAFAIAATSEGAYACPTE